MSDGGAPAGYEQPRGPASPQEAEREKFVSLVLGDTEETWKTIFQQSGKQYEEPTLVLFSGAVDSACGSAQAATGPFYCPGDRKLYVDLSFFDELEQRFGAPGDFAQAYVVAHEVGHHVQTLLGITQQVQSARQQIGSDQGNQLSVLTELQADCYAGVWANHAQEARQVLEPGDIEEGLRAAAAVGDDRIQRETQGRVVPDSFTHGSSEQRMTWFRRGLERGDVNQCDTFQAAGM
jgi:predicted metalloprotease